MQTSNTTMTDQLRNILGKPSTAPSPKQQMSFMHDDWRDDPYSYSGFGRGSSIGYGRGYTPKSSKKIAVTYPNGQSDLFYLQWEHEGWYDFGKQHFPEQGDALLVPVDRCAFSYGEPKFNPCVYTATNEYMQARWGRKLDDSDRRWLARHPLSTDGGVPQEYTATCISQLVAPYGLRVSRIRLRKGSLVLGDAVTAWMQALGVNPLALADRSTTNEEAAAMFGMSREQANDLWRVEFHDTPLPCSIIGERGWTNQQGVATGSLGGHARYLAPRATAGDWFISLQLEVDEKVTYLVEPPSPEYVERQGEPTLLVSSITDDQGKPIAVRTNNKWHRAGEQPPVFVPVTTVTTPEPQTIHDDWPDPNVNPVAFDAKVVAEMDDDQTLLDCFCCGAQIDSTYSYAGTDTCLACAEEAWHSLQCPHCKVSLDLNLPEPHNIVDAYEFACMKCDQIIEVPFRPDNPSDRVLVEFAEHIFQTFTDYPELIS